MKKTILLASASSLLLSMFVQPAIAEEYCTKLKSTAKMSYTEAQQIAKTNEACAKVGKLKKNHWCNENSGTWWIMLEAKIPNCSPACVINITDKTAGVNYMCTGLLATKKKSAHIAKK